MIPTTGRMAGKVQVVGIPVTWQLSGKPPKQTIIWLRESDDKPFWGSHFYKTYTMLTIQLGFHPIIWWWHDCAWMFTKSCAKNPAQVLIQFPYALNILIYSPMISTTSFAGWFGVLALAAKWSPCLKKANFSIKWDTINLYNFIHAKIYKFHIARTASETTEHGKAVLPVSSLWVRTAIGQPEAGEPNHRPCGPV